MATEKAPKGLIEVSASSVVDLKAELFKSQETFNREKLISKTTSAASRKPTKKPAAWARQNKGVSQRAERDRIELSDTTSTPTWEDSRAALERKAKLYKKMSRGEIEDNTKEDEALIDFDAPTRRSRSSSPLSSSDSDSVSSDPWVEHVDEFGRNRVIRRSQLPPPPSPKIGIAYNYDDPEANKEQWEWPNSALQEEDKEENPLAQHYDTSRERRNKGVGFYAFSKDEEEREKQLEELNKLRKQTETQRKGFVSVREKRKKILEERAEKVNAAKRAKGIEVVDEKAIDGLLQSIRSQYES